MADPSKGLSISLAAHLLDWTAARQKLLASNIANLDTPGYKARDLDFQSALLRACGNGESGLHCTNERHLSGKDATPSRPFPVQESGARLDGNTVNLAQEMARITENGFLYQTLVRFINHKITTLKQAIRGV
jgi:flagellar basal-body rod protein FlgB